MLNSLFINTCRDKHAIPATAAALIHIYEMLTILGIHIHCKKNMQWRHNSQI